MTAAIGALVRLAPAPRARLAVAVLLGALTVTFGVGLMAMAGYLISRAAERPAILSLTVAIVAVRFFGLGRPFVRYLDRLASHDLALRVLTRVRLRFYERIEPLAPAQLAGFRRGDLLSRMVADVDALQNLYLRGLGPPLVAVLAGAVSVGATAAFLPDGALALLGGLLVAGVAVPSLAGATGARSARRQAGARGELSAELVELLQAAPEIATFGGEAARVARARDVDATLVKLARRDALASGLADGAGLVVTGVTVAAVLAVAIAASDAGRLDRVLIGMLALLALASFEAVAPLAGIARDLSATLAAGDRILELTRRDSVIVDPVAPLPAPSWPFTVALERVRARYPLTGRPALDHLSLVLEPGEHVALVGASGAGKTTVVNLLLRFLDPEHGRVTLGGHDLCEYRQADVRHAIAVAGQDSHLFSTSIRANLRLARPEATDADLEQALRRARIWSWISQLPDGLDTAVGELGCELSGGQRQRIVLARALLAEAPVVVLDEPTAHLDPDTAELLVADVFSAMAEKTVLLITHRGEGLDLVDRVITIEPVGVTVG
jgi:thiol reductant ABC exporter CydC subunit